MLFENRVQRKIFGLIVEVTGEKIKLLHEDSYNLYSPSLVISMMKSRG
jgi:hypothetical protein